MLVTLKKCSALAAALAAKSVEVPSSYSCSVFGNVPNEEQIKASYDAFEAAVTNAINLQDAVYTLRGLVMSANEGKINNLIHERIKLDKRLSLLLALPNRKAGTDLAAMAREMEAKREYKDSSTYASLRKDMQVVVFEIETATCLDALISATKKARIAVDDELVRLNYSTTVDIPEEVEKLLSSFDLI